MKSKPGAGKAFEKVLSAMLTTKLLSRGKISEPIQARRKARQGGTGWRNEIARLQRFHYCPTPEPK